MGETIWLSLCTALLYTRYMTACVDAVKQANSMRGMEIKGGLTLFLIVRIAAAAAAEWLGEWSLF